MARVSPGQRVNKSTESLPQKYKIMKRITLLMEVALFAITLFVQHNSAKQRMYSNINSVL